MPKYRAQLQIGDKQAIIDKPHITETTLRLSSTEVAPVSAKTTQRPERGALAYRKRLAPASGECAFTYP